MYGQEQPQNSEDVRQFTQMIWEESKMIGLGMAFDKEGIIYFVCNYDPPGNVEGAFAENVLPMKEEGQELLQHEAEGIRIVEPRLEIVKSMERLYAVPSEKLRVWSIWLSQVGEVADEWQRWIRAHIDLIVRLSDYLHAAELAIRRSKMEVVSLTESKTKHVDERVDEIGDPAGAAPGIVEEAIDSTDDQLKQEASERDIAELPELSKTTVAGDSSVTLTPSNVNVEPSTASVDASQITVIEVTGTSAGASKTTVTEASKTSVTEASKLTNASKIDAEGKDTVMTWPLGTPWEHLGLEDACDEEEFEKLPLPSNEEEMREFLKKFTHEATVYRSYYKHWQETASQATKEVGGRLVLATYRVQGRDETGRIKRPPRKPCVEKVDRKVKAPSKKNLSMKSDKQSVVSATPEVTADEDNLDASQIASEATLTAQSGVSLGASESQSVSKVTVIERSAASVGASKSQTPSSRATLKERSQARLDKESQKSIVVADWIRDCARAMEPIPYIFYVKAEPDIDIAIEHDDEEVILADLDRENVVASSKRIFFNLKDKPCKGGKPWI
nr:PREDICTED: cell wall protein PRY3-like isoform X2 [Megachile rotundata]